MLALLLDLLALLGLVLLCAAAWCSGPVAGLAATGTAVLIVSALTAWARK